MKCKGCVHRRPLSSAPSNDNACHYCIDTEEPRGCSVEECFKKKIHYTTQRKLTFSQEKAKLGGMAKSIRGKLNA